MDLGSRLLISGRKNHWLKNIKPLYEDKTIEDKTIEDKT
jgi:hypothetical protein